MDRPGRRPYGRDRNPNGGGAAVLTVGDSGTKERGDRRPNGGGSAPPPWCFLLSSRFSRSFSLALGQNDVTMASLIVIAWSNTPEGRRITQPSPAQFGSKQKQAWRGLAWGVAVWLFSLYASAHPPSVCPSVHPSSWNSE